MPPILTSRKLRWASLWPALAAVLVAGLLLLWLLPGTLYQAAGDQLQDGIQVLLPPVLEQIRDGNDLQAYVSRLTADSELRITLITPEGEVLADSARREEEIAAMDDHSTRPEVRRALREGRGSAVRQSDTTYLRYVYAARYVEDGPSGPVILRLAEPLRAFDRLRSGLAATLALAVLVALGVAAAVAWYLDRRLFLPLASLIEHAEVMARGGRYPRVEPPEEPEAAQLARALNRLAGRAEDQLAALQGERDQLSAILESMSEGVLLVDAAGHGVSANRSFYRLLHIGEDAVGRPVLDVSRRKELVELIETTLAHRRRERREVELRRPERRTLTLSGTPLSSAQGGAVIVARDTTEANRLHEMRRDFVANVSHELRTPLSAVRAFAETLRDGAWEDGATAKRFIDRILEHCRRLEALLRDLLILSRLESPAPPGGLGEEDDAPRPTQLVALPEVVRRAAETVAPHAAGCNVQVTTPDPDLSLPEVAGDPDALERMVLNLLENAVKYNREGGRVEVRLGTVEGPGGAPRVLLEVEDDGIGIPEDARERIFERFYRVDKGRSRDDGGTGLGLAIVKHVAQSHGGEVTVDSDLELGSCFRVDLPAAPARRKSATG